MARRLDPISQRLAAKSHQLQIVRVSAADAIGFLIEREMREQVERVKQLVERAAKLSRPLDAKADRLAAGVDRRGLRVDDGRSAGQLR
jgi:hypothetical protein